MNPGLSGEAAEGGVSRKVCRFLSGVDVGLSAALAVLSWLVLHSWLRGEYWWAKLNVAGALFYGPAVYTMGLGWATVAGFALLLVVYTLLGLAYAGVARTEGFARNLLLALGWSAVWHMAAQRWFWPGLDAFGSSYFPAQATLPAHLIAALCLARFGVRYRSLALAFGDPEWATALAEEPAGVVMQAPEEAARELREAAPEAGAEAPERAAGEPSGSGAGPETGDGEDDGAGSPEARREDVGRKDERADC